MPLSALDEIIASLKALPQEELAILDKQVNSIVGDLKFIPSPGPQTAAYYSEADILLYGGQPGGGKTSLLIGLALNCHHRSMIVRKQFTDLAGVVDNAKGIVGSQDGFIGGNRPMYRKADGGVIHFEGLSDGVLDTGKQGNPHDFIGVDEGAQLPEQAIRMLKGWNRAPKNKNQRCRMVIASNPPLDATGEWMADFFAPWLDDKYPNPAKDGELRWFIFNEEDKSEEVNNNSPFERNGRMFYPHSRTFIRSTLDDNPYLDSDDYKRQLDMLPEPWRTILQTGNFLLGRRDQENQIIPTAWVRAAMARWTPQKPNGVPMTAIAIDPAAGGDETTVAPLYDSYFAEIIAERVPDGKNNAAMLLTNRRDNATVVIDMGGGYGGSIALLLQENNIEYVAYKGAEATAERAKDGSKLPFANKRTKDLWRFREALNPEQEGGSQIALPPSNKLLADLTSVCFKPMVSKQVLQAESKEEVKKRLGRSPDEGDAVIMAWSVGGNRVAAIQGGWQNHSRGKQPKVVLSHQNRRR